MRAGARLFGSALGLVPIHVRAGVRLFGVQNCTRVAPDCSDLHWGWCRLFGIELGLVLDCSELPQGWCSTVQS